MSHLVLDCYTSVRFVARERAFEVAPNLGKPLVVDSCCEELPRLHVGERSLQMVQQCHFLFLKIAKHRKSTILESPALLSAGGKRRPEASHGGKDHHGRQEREFSGELATERSSPICSFSISSVSHNGASCGPSLPASQHCQPGMPG